MDRNEFTKKDLAWLEANGFCAKGDNILGTHYVLKTEEFQFDIQRLSDGEYMVFIEIVDVCFPCLNNDNPFGTQAYGRSIKAALREANRKFNTFIANCRASAKRLSAIRKELK